MFVQISIHRKFSVDITVITTVGQVGTVLNVSVVTKHSPRSLLVTMCHGTTAWQTQELAMPRVPSEHEAFTVCDKSLTCLAHADKL